MENILKLNRNEDANSRKDKRYGRNASYGGIDIHIAMHIYSCAIQKKEGKNILSASHNAKVKCNGSPGSFHYCLQHPPRGGSYFKLPERKL